MAQMFVEGSLKVACKCVCGNQVLCLTVQLFMPKSTGIQPGKEKKQDSEIRLTKPLLTDPSGKPTLVWYRCWSSTCYRYPHLTCELGILQGGTSWCVLPRLIGAHITSSPPGEQLMGVNISKHLLTWPALFTDKKWNLKIKFHQISG